jgi:hypothetical protein
MVLSKTVGLRGRACILLNALVLTASASIQAAAQSVSERPYGAWRGQVQFQASVAGKVDQTAHTVVNLSLAIDPQGKIIGSSPENSCRVLGVASPGLGPTLLSLDVTFSGCAYAGYNRRFAGSLAYHAKDGYAALSLTAAQFGIGKVAASFDIQGPLRR